MLHSLFAHQGAMFTDYRVEWLLHAVVVKRLHRAMDEQMRKELTIEANVLHEIRHPKSIDVLR